MSRALLLKMSFWLMVIGAVALVTPQPAWPTWAGWAALLGGALLAPLSLVGGGLRRSGKNSDRRRFGQR